MAAVARKRQGRGCRAIEYGGTPHLLDCMMMLQKFWNGNNGKYVSDEMACCCWRKADILPVTWNAEKKQCWQCYISTQQKHYQ